MKTLYLSTQQVWRQWKKGNKAERERERLTTSEKATERDPRSIQNAAVYLLSTMVAIILHDNAPRRPDRTKYDRLLYPNNGTESLQQTKNVYGKASLIQMHLG